MIVQSTCFPLQEDFGSYLRISQTEEERKQWILVVAGLPLAICYVLHQEKEALTWSIVCRVILAPTTYSSSP